MPDLDLIFTGIASFLKTAPIWQSGTITFFILIIIGATSYDLYKRGKSVAYAEAARKREEIREKIFLKAWLKFMAVFSVIGVIIVFSGIYFSE